MSIKMSCRLTYLATCLLMMGCGSDRIADLVAKLGSPDVEIRRAAVRALGEQSTVDDRVLPVLISAVADSDPEVRRLSITALGQIGAPAKSSVPALKSALQDCEETVRLKAALAIQRIDPQDHSFVPVLVIAMREGDGRTMLAVGGMGADGAWAVPTLIGLLSHEQAKVRGLAAQTLGRIGPSASDAKPVLQRALRDSNAAVQSAAKVALERIQSESSNK